MPCCNESDAIKTEKQLLWNSAKKIFGKIPKRLAEVLFPHLLHSHMQSLTYKYIFAKFFDFASVNCYIKSSLLAYKNTWQNIRGTSLKRIIW